MYCAGKQVCFCISMFRNGLLGNQILIIENTWEITHNAETDGTWECIIQYANCNTYYNIQFYCHLQYRSKNIKLTVVTSPKVIFVIAHLHTKHLFFAIKTPQILWDSISSGQIQLGCAMRVNFIVCLYNYKITQPVERHYNWGKHPK